MNKPKVPVLTSISAMNISIMTTTQSQIAADLDAFEQATWLTSSYLVAMSSVSPLVGKFASIFSPRAVLAFSTVIIALGTVITSLSFDLSQFLVGRIVSGAGAGNCLITATIIAVQYTPIDKRGFFIGLINSGMTTGVSLGAVIAGALESSIGWRALFGFQAPLCLLAGISILFALPKTLKYDGKSARSERITFATIDYPGAVLLTSTIVSLLVGLAGTKVLILPIIISAVLLPVFLLYEIYFAKDPVIPMTVLKSRGTLLTCLATVGFMMSRWSVLFFSPQW
jgi:MFS family permease